MRTVQPFWNLVMIGEGCWEWCGSRQKNRYGYYRAKLAHRVAWEDFNGPIPTGLMALHKCDNPICVNPDHLFLGTQSDNMFDMWAKKRHSHVRPDHCPSGHPYDQENTYEFRRVCKTCARNRANDYYRRKKLACA